MRCPNCGKDVHEGLMVCPHCSETLPITDDTYDANNSYNNHDSYNNYNSNNSYNNYDSYNPNNSYNNYDSYNNYNSGSYESPSLVNSDTNYDRKPKKNLKRPILIILMVAAILFIIYSATTKNGTYECKDKGTLVTLKVDGNKFTLKFYMAYSSGLSLKRDYMKVGEYSGKIKFVGSTAKLALNGSTVNFKYNSSKKTITFELPTEYGSLKYELKKKWFS